MGQGFESLQARHFDMVDIAQLVRALDCGSRGRRFDSDYPPHLIKTMRKFGLRFYLSGGLGCRQVGKAPDSDSGIS